VIAYSYFATKDEWHFEGPEGPVSVRTRPWLHTNNGETCLAAALADQGVILQPSFLVAPALAAGPLVSLMPAYCAHDIGIHAVYPSRKHVSAKVRVLIDFLAEHFAGQDASW
jgi:DNA-binding transcriptional LysR family regulator